MEDLQTFAQIYDVKEIKDKVKKGQKLGYNDSMDLLILEYLLPVLYNGFLNLKNHIKAKAEGNYVHIENLFDSYNVSMSFLSVLEPELEKRIKKIYNGNQKIRKTNKTTTKE